MSGLLAGKVWMSALKPTLKPLAATLADIADDDGTSIYPTIAYVAWRLGAGQRTVTRGIGELLLIGVLVKVDEPHHHRPAEYTLIEAALPKRDGWGGVKQRKVRGAGLATHQQKQGGQFGTPLVETGVPSTTGRGANGDVQGCQPRQGGVPFEADLLPLSLNDPSVPVSETSERKSVDTPPARPAVADLVITWNAHRQPGPKILHPERLSGKRYRLLDHALDESPDLSDWIVAIVWLNGQRYANARGTGQNGTWRATLDWLAKPGELAKVLETAATDDVAPPHRPRRPGDLPSDGPTHPPEQAAEIRRRRDDADQYQQARYDEAAALALDLSDRARAHLETAVLEELELNGYRERISASAFDDLVLRALPQKLLDQARGRPLVEVVAELEGKVVAA